jgi:hypothetical protein
MAGELFFGKKSVRSLPTDGTVRKFTDPTDLTEDLSGASSGHLGGSTAAAGTFLDLQASEERGVQYPLINQDGTVEGYVMAQKAVRVSFNYTPRSVASGDPTSTEAKAVKLSPGDLIRFSTATGNDLSAVLGDKATSSASNTSKVFIVLSAPESNSATGDRSISVSAVQFEDTNFAKIS